MSARATFLRWLVTFLSFPVGGLLAVTVVGSISGPQTAAAAGLIAGAVLGLGQWLALRPTGVTPWWIAATSGAFAVGMSAAVTLTGAATTTGALVVTGAVSGAFVGLAQGLLRSASTRAWASGIAWALVTSAAWAIGWLITSQVIVDADRGYATFGSSGAIFVTIATGLLVRRLIVVPRDAPATHTLAPAAAATR